LLILDINACGGFGKAALGQTFSSEPLTEVVWWRV